MAPTPEIFIQVDNPARSYFPGQTITGTVVTNFHRAKDKCSSLSISIEGKARVHWTESHTHTEGSGEQQRSVTRTEVFTANEDYFDVNIMLLTGANGNLIIPGGTSVYPFQFMLPQNLPSSYTSVTGKIMYFMTARIKRSWNRFDITCTLPFTINGVLDLNNEVGATNQIARSKDKTICCCCCASGPVGFKLSIPRTGFVPGEGIPITVEMTNMSNIKVSKTTLKLMQTVIYHARGKSRQSVKAVSTATGPGVPRRENETWNSQSVLRIPPVPPTRLAGCHIIDCNYSLVFTMELTGASTNLKTHFPITIGTIPLRQFFVDLMPSSTRHDLNGVPNYNAFLPSFPGPSHSSQYYPPGTSQDFRFPSGSQQPFVPTAPIFDAYPDLPPPTYAEAIATDNLDTNPTPYEPPSLTDNSQSKKQDPEGDSPTAPPPEYDFSNDSSFVPNYITYGFLPSAS